MIEPFVWKCKGEVVYGFFSALDGTGFITHGLSTKMGGVSTGHFSAMNLAYNSEDKPERVKKNYQLFTTALDVKLDHAVLSHQTHHTNIRKITADDKGKGITRNRDFESVDGLITDEADIPLMTFHADCVPLLFVDPVTNSIGLAHAGWKGTAYNLAGKMIEAMSHAYGTNASDLLVGIGPSIRECCFVIRDDVRQVFLKELPFMNKHIKVVSENQWTISLQKVNAELLAGAGIASEHIYDAGVCTCCRSDLLFSHRAMGNNRGTMAALLQINMKRAKDGVVDVRGNEPGTKSYESVGRTGNSV